MAKSRKTGQESLKQRLREALRSVFTKFHLPRREALADARRLQQRTKKDGEEAKQPAVFYKCADCQELYKATEVAVDHLEPVGATPEWPPETEGDWERWMLKVYCDATNLQCLCRTCHSRKTKGEQQDAALQRRRDGPTSAKRAKTRPRVVGKKLGHK